MSEPIAGDLVLAPSPARRRVLALAAALSAGLATAAVITIAAAGARDAAPPGLRVMALAALLCCLHAAASRGRDRSGCRLLLVPEQDPPDAAMQPRSRPARAVAAWRRAWARPGCVTLAGARAVHVSPRRIVLRSASGGAVVWRDAVDGDTFRRLAVRARWARARAQRY